MRNHLTPPFRWDPLDAGQIRLIKCSNGSGNAISYELLHFDLEDATQTGYYALSYVYGLAKPGHELYCSLKTIDLPRPINITPNLEAALDGVNKLNHKLSSGIAFTHLWVDAICINQLDLAEKSAQVAEIHQVYRNADKVLIWL